MASSDAPSAGYKGAAMTANAPMLSVEHQAWALTVPNRLHGLSANAMLRKAGRVQGVHIKCQFFRKP